MRTFDGRYRFTTEGDRAIGALIEARAIPVVIDLVGEGGGHGTAHESAEAIRLCLLALHSMARFSEEAVRDVISGMGIGALVALLTMDFCVMSNLLDTYVDNDPNGTHTHTHTFSTALDVESVLQSVLQITLVHSLLSFVPGPLEVQEESGRHVWMSVMAESLRILQHLSRQSPEPAVAAALNERTLDKCLELCLPQDEDRKSLSRELRVESIKTMAVLCVVSLSL
jgi:hypothetical protein